MDEQNYLGIYLGTNTASVVCLCPEANGRKLLGCFNVAVEDGQDILPATAFKQLAEKIAQGCAERKLIFSSAAIAIDCSMYMQHSIHSEFTDSKQITATIRFDTEEAIAMDIKDLAIAYLAKAGDSTGSQVIVFTSEKRKLDEILTAFQSNNIDPVSLEPDASSLLRFAAKKMHSPAENIHPLTAMLSRQNGYLITTCLSQGKEDFIFRSFLAGPPAQRTELLARQVPLTIASVRTDEPINCIRILDTERSVDLQQLQQRTTLATAEVNLVETAGIDAELLTETFDAVGFAVAYGAASGDFEKEHTINFRNDFNPYQGKKIRMLKMIKMASIAATVFMFILGIYFQILFIRNSKPYKEQYAQLAEQYNKITGKKRPAKPDNVIKEFKKLRTQIENIKKGQTGTGEQSISAKLTRVLAAFNSCASRTDLNIVSISVSDKTVRVEGDTSSRNNTLAVFEALKASGLSVSQEKLESAGGRASFSVSVFPGK